MVFTNLSAPFDAGFSGVLPAPYIGSAAQVLAPDTEFPGAEVLVFMSGQDLYTADLARISVWYGAVSTVGVVLVLSYRSTAL